MTAAAFERPVLRRYPDGRKAPFPLFDPLAFPYIALIFGTVIAGLAGCINAFALRRYGLAARTLLLGICGWLGGFLLLLVFLEQAGIENVQVRLIIARIWHILIGFVQFSIHRPYARGHQFLNGAMIPILPAYLATFVLSRLIPFRITLILLGVPIVP